MQSWPKIHRPLTALILLAACTSRETTQLQPTGEGAGAGANPIQLGQVRAAVSADELPACANVEPEAIFFVDAPSTKVGFYRCDSEGAWQLVGVPVAAGDRNASTLASINDGVISVGLDDDGDGTLDPEEIDLAGTLCDVPKPDAGVGAGEADAGVPQQPEPVADAGTVEPPTEADAGSVTPPVTADAGSVEPPPPVLGACLRCAQTICPVQYQNALGAGSTAENLAKISQLLSCVSGEDWAEGKAIPAGSCFFSDPAQPSGSMVPCYCGSTPTGQCLASGPADNTEACGLEIELASGCSPITASCVTQSGSNPEVALGDVLQLLNCERVGCTSECGFPPPPIED